MGSEKIPDLSDVPLNNKPQGARPRRRKRDTGPPDLTLYWVLVLLRIGLTLIPQTGYIHPDEFFQTIEVVAGDIFDLEISKPWEFNVTFPVRSILLPKLIYGIPYVLLDTFTPDINEYFGFDIRSSYLMLILPRLAACALSFVTDFCLYKICILYGSKYRSRLLILASSYVLLVFGTRTFNNSIEMALLSLLLYQVADCMLLSERVLYQHEFLDKKYSSVTTPVERVQLFKLRGSLPPHTFRHCFSIASTVVAGIFNRPTFLAFGFAPVFFWLQRGLRSKHSGLRDFHIRILAFTLCTIPSICLFILVDSLYYGHLTWGEISMGDVSLNNFVVTPFNFLLYNSRESNLAQHGLHPRFTHLLVNIPLLYNVLGFTAVVAIYQFFVRASQARWRELPRVHSILMLMTASLVIPVLVLSLVPHQEPRFLIPITLPLVFLHAQEIRDMDTPFALMYRKQDSIQGHKSSSFAKLSSKKKQKGVGLIYSWVALNVLLVLFFGFLHQGGVYSLTSHLRHSLSHQKKLEVVHLVTSHMYSVPHSLLVQRNSQRKYFNHITKTSYLITRKFYSYELGSAPMQNVVTKISDILHAAEMKRQNESLNYVVYLALPSSVVEEFTAYVGSNLTYQTEKTFYPHFSSEALPRPLTFVKSKHSKPCPETAASDSMNDFTVSVFEEDVDDACPLSTENIEEQQASLTLQVLYLLKQFGLTLLKVDKS